MADRVSAEEQLREELMLLRLVVVRRLRERLEKEAPTPAWLDVARKLLGDMLPPQAPPRARPVVEDLPFSTPDEE